MLAAAICTLHLLRLQNCLALQEALRKAWHRAQQLVAHVSLSPADVSMASAMLALPQVSLVGTAAANNVNANLNSVILQLSNTVGTVIELVIQLCLSGSGEGLCWP